ncbi:hypothetical protein FS837_005758 [Tulasnella sp. UAMH 9824]|nr:hypothetical protein FS837_005758 [Tulasnella sp. UAMH 9824]
MDRTAHYPAQSAAGRSSTSAIPSFELAVAPGQRAASGHITTPPSTTNNMIGPSPSYVPNDYNDIQAVLYSRGGYPQPPSGGAPSASISASYFPPPPSVAGNVYGSPPYAGQAYDQRYASPEQQAPGAARHSVSPRTGYEGWKDATDSTYSGLPNAATTTSMDSMTGAFPSANDGQYGMNLSQLTQASPNGSAASTYHAMQSHQQPSPFGPAADHFSSPPLVPDNSSFSIHTSPPNQQTTSPDSTYYSSPTQIYDNVGARGSISQQPILFSSPDQKPIVRYVPPQPAPPEGRRIAGSQRVQQRMNSISTNAISGSQSDIGPNSAGGLRPSLGGGSGFSSRSAGSAGSANYGLPISNPYLVNNGQNSVGGSAQQSGASSSTPKTAARPATTTTRTNPNKRARHSHTDSLNVPGWQPQRSSANQLPPQSGPQGVPADLAAAFPGVRFDAAAFGTIDSLGDSSSSEDSEEEEDGGRAQTSSRGGRGGKGGKAGKAGRKNAIPPGMARLPGACKNCKRLKPAHGIDAGCFRRSLDEMRVRIRYVNEVQSLPGREQRVHRRGEEATAAKQYADLTHPLPPPKSKREQLMNLLREKDKLIEQLLRSVHNPAKLLANNPGLRAPSPSAQSRDASGSNQGLSIVPGVANSLAPAQPSPTISKDIGAWVAASNARGRSISPRKSDPGLTLEGSSDEEEAVGRTGIIDIEARDTSVPVSESSAMDSVSQRGDRTDTLSTTSSNGMLAPRDGKERRLSAGDLPKMHSLPDATAPHGLFAELSIESQTAEEREAERERQRKRLQSMSSSSLGSSYHQDKSSGASGKDPSDALKDPLEDEALGPANKNYWRPGPAQNLAFRRLLNERNPPELLAMGFINLEDVDKLFKIFYDRLNVFLSILDPVIHSPVDIFGRSPFLFTVICAVASRYYTEKPHIYSVAMHYARTAAAMALVEGIKSVETCQAYIIMSVYPTPARRWEEDRSWLYLRLAIGMATDLSLHVPSSTTKFLDERHEREILNRTRTWIICFNLDRSGATQFGKPPSIKEDTVIRRSPTWYKKSPHNHCYDVHMVAYTELLRLVGGFLEEVYSDPNSPTGLNKELNFTEVTVRYDVKLAKFREETETRFMNESDSRDPACRYRNELLPFLVNYSRLVMFSFGFQQAFQRGTLERGNRFLTTCIEAASGVLKSVVDVMAPSGYLRYAADGHFVFAAFASAYLLKVLRPPFASTLEHEQQSRILALVNRVIKTLASPEVAPHLLGGDSMYRDDAYAYSTAASSTIDAQTRDTATQYSNEDVLMQGDENWIATMGALDNPAFWTNGMLPGFQWPSPPEGTWQQPLAPDNHYTNIPQHEPTQQHMHKLVSPVILDIPL